MTAEMLSELSGVFYAESNALVDPYGWPPRCPPPEDIEEANRLREIGYQLYEASHVADAPP